MRQMLQMLQMLQTHQQSAQILDLAPLLRWHRLSQVKTMQALSPILQQANHSIS